MPHPVQLVCTYSPYSRPYNTRGCRSWTKADWGIHAAGPGHQKLGGLSSSPVADCRLLFVGVDIALPPQINQSRPESREDGPTLGRKGANGEEVSRSGYCPGPCPLIAAKTDIGDGEPRRSPPHPHCELLTLLFIRERGKSGSYIWWKKQSEGLDEKYPNKQGTLDILTHCLLSGHKQHVNEHARRDHVLLDK
jgi:hypothetical protein